MNHSKLTLRQNVRALAVISALFMAVSVQAKTTGSADLRYTVRPKDTVSSLTQKHLKPSIGWQALARYNHLPNEHVIHPGTQLRVPLRWLAAKQAQAKLTAISGEVQIKSVGGAWHSAQLTELLQTGQMLQVGANSSARLQFADMSELVMQPHSTVELDTLSVYVGGYMADTQLRLQAGRVEVRANPRGRQGQKFDVITPAAVASVRGTQFVVEAQADRTLEQTSQGKVTFQSGNARVLVQEGYASAVKVGEDPSKPEVIKPAPVLKNPASKFLDFPIEFVLAEPADATGWVMQIGHDAQMAQLVLAQQTSQPQWDIGGLADGAYYLRIWSLDAQSMPSKPVLHPFEVRIPRQLQGPAIQLPPQYFSQGPMALNLPPLSQGQRYLVQLTKDAQGREPIWHIANAGTSLSVPAFADQDRPYYLWIWTY